MTVNSLKAISYITSVATNELTILQWINLLNKVYPRGIPEEAKFGSVISYFVERFPDFEKRAEDDSQDNYDKLYTEFITFCETYKH